MTAGIVLLGLALPLSIAGVNVALGVLSVFALASWTEPKKWRAVSNPVFYALVAYCAAGLLCSALGLSPLDSVRGWAKDFHKLWVATLLLVAFDEENAPPAVAAALFAGFAVAAAAGVVEFASGPAGHWARAHGFVHPVSFACQLVFALLGCGAFFARTPKGLEGWRKPVAALTALLLAALILNQTRAAAIALLVGAAALAAVERKGRLVLAAAALTAAAAAGIWELAPTGGRTFSSVMTTSVSASEPQHARWVLWGAAWKMFRDHPATGVGPGGYRAAFPSYFSGTLDGERDWGSAHNLYLHQLAERGVLGALALLAVFAAVFLRLWRAERRARSAWTLWAGACWAAYLVLNMTETSFQTEQTATLALFAWACAEGERARTSKKL